MDPSSYFVFVALLQPSFFEKMSFSPVFEYIRDRVQDMSLPDAIPKKREATASAPAPAQRRVIPMKRKAGGAWWRRSGEGGGVGRWKGCL